MRTVLIVLLATFCLPAPSQAQIKAQLPEAPMTPPWDKGIQPISRDSYWNAVECGKQGGARPACVFYDADLCKNDDFTLALYTPYKSVAYEVWRVVKSGQPAPTPSYGEAQRTRVTVGVTRAAGSKNTITGAADQAGRQDHRADGPRARRHRRKVHLRLRAVRAHRRDHDRGGRLSPHAELHGRAVGVDDVPLTGGGALIAGGLRLWF